jgi:hypothetical protein
MDGWRLNGLVRTEQRAWKDRLDRIEGELKKLKKLTKRDWTQEVLNTSVLVEGKPFVTFEWHSLDPRVASDSLPIEPTADHRTAHDELRHDPPVLSPNLQPWPRTGRRGLA